MTRAHIINTLRDYFTKKGKFLTEEEYNEQADRPFRSQIIKRSLGKWSRVERFIGELEVAPVEVVKPVPVKPTPTKPVTAAKVVKK